PLRAWGGTRSRGALLAKSRERVCRKLPRGLAPAAGEQDLEAERNVFAGMSRARNPFFPGLHLHRGAEEKNWRSRVPLRGRGSRQRRWQTSASAPSVERCG